MPRQLSTSRLRQAGIPLPVFYLVDPKGRIFHQKFVRNANGGLLYEDKNGKVRIEADRRDEGYRYLSELYAQDSRPDFKENGMSWYLDFARAKSKPKIEIDGEGGRKVMVIAPFPLDLCPEEVLARKEQRSEFSAQVWEPPKVKGKRGGTVKA